MTECDESTAKTMLSILKDAVKAGDGGGRGDILKAAGLVIGAATFARQIAGSAPFSVSDFRVDWIQRKTYCTVTRNETSVDEEVANFAFLPLARCGTNIWILSGGFIEKGLHLNVLPASRIFGTKWTTAISLPEGIMLPLRKEHTKAWFWGEVAALEESLNDVAANKRAKQSARDIATDNGLESSMCAMVE